MNHPVADSMTADALVLLLDGWQLLNQREPGRKTSAFVSCRDGDFLVKKTITAAIEELTLHIHPVSMALPKPQTTEALPALAIQCK